MNESQFQQASSAIFDRLDSAIDRPRAQKPVVPMSVMIKFDKKMGLGAQAFAGFLPTASISVGAHMLGLMNGQAAPFIMSAAVLSGFASLFLAVASEDRSPLVYVAATIAKLMGKEVPISADQARRLQAFSESHPRLKQAAVRAATRFEGQSILRSDFRHLERAYNDFQKVWGTRQVQMEIEKSMESTGISNSARALLQSKSLAAATPLATECAPSPRISRI